MTDKQSTSRWHSDGGYTLYHVGALGQQIYTATHNTKKSAMAEFNRDRRYLKDGQLPPSVVEVCVYRWVDIEMIATSMENPQ